jgi:hypothetical protein
MNTWLQVLMEQYSPLDRVAGEAWQELGQSVGNLAQMLHCYTSKNQLPDYYTSLLSPWSIVNTPFLPGTALPHHHIIMTHPPQPHLRDKCQQANEAKAKQQATCSRSQCLQPPYKVLLHFRKRR